jgi:putative oxidoreductase
MSRATWDDLGRLLLRVTVGGLLLLHGIHKLTHGISWLFDDVHAHGLPSFVAYGVYLGEVVAPIFLILGIGTRVAGLVVAFNMIMAIWLSHASQIFTLGKSGGSAIELDLLYLFGGVSAALIGPGRWSVSRGAGRLD